MLRSIQSVLPRNIHLQLSTPSYEHVNAYEFLGDFLSASLYFSHKQYEDMGSFIHESNRKITQERLGDGGRVLTFYLNGSGVSQVSKPSRQPYLRKLTMREYCRTYEVYLKWA